MDNKITELENYIAKYTSKPVVVAFSGGVDSSLILKIACDKAKEASTTVYAIMAHTRLHPAGDEMIARDIANEYGAIFKVVDIDELDEAGIKNNPEDRCYRCKKYIFGKLVDVAKEVGAEVLFDGTNEDDLHVYRPGLKALQEYGIISPLAACHISKEDVRKMAAKYGIVVSNRPSMPCLATRLPYGTAISYELLEKIDKGETFLRKLGFYNVRLRIHDDICRIEVDKEQFDLFMAKREDIIKELSSLDMTYITLDLNGFISGSMDRKIVKES